MNIIKDNSGQGLLELIVAIGVITVGLFSVWGLFISNFNAEREAGARIIAINLAREGMEAVRNIRDSNWLHIEDNSDCVYNGTAFNPCKWDSGLPVGFSAPKNIFYGDVYLDSISGLEDFDAKLFIYHDTSLYYNHYNPDTDIPTAYRRIIEIENICCFDYDFDLKCDDSSSANFSIKETDCSTDELKIGIDVKSKVQWTLEGKNRELTIYNQMFNWK